MYGSPLLNAVGLLDGISAIERIKLTGQLTAQVGALGEAGNALARVQAAKTVAELVKRLTGDAAESAVKPPRTKLTTQRLHSVIQAGTGVLSSKYSPSQRIDRTTYDVNTMLKGVYGVMSSKNIKQIAEVLRAAGIQFDDGEIAKGFVKVPVWQESAIAEPAKAAEAGDDKQRIRNFGWDAVKLSDLSMEDLRTLREQVEAEHANPFDAENRYTENGQPTIHLYDKKGRWKLDKLAWAVTYKLQEKKAEPSEESKPEKADARVIRAWHGVKREDLDIYLADGRLIYAPKFGAFSTDWKIEPGIWFSTDKKFAAKYGEPVEFLLTIRDPLRHEAPLKAAPAGHDAVYRMHGKGDEIDRALEIAVFSPDQIELADPIPAGAVKLSDGDEAPAEPDAQALEIIEHVTGRGKTLRGVIRTDLTYAQAKEIDPYTFAKAGADGKGYFIREQHLDGYTPGDAAPVVKPELTPEQQAQAEADRIADEQLRQQKKRAEQVSKLRESAQSTIDKAEEDLGRDRNTNTARRANMAANINERNEQARAIGKTMMNLAGAIESGEAKALAGVTSKAAVETLHNALVSAMYEADKGLTYQQQLARKGRKAEPEDVRFAKFPSTSWDSASTSRAKVLEAIKGKRGAPALADKVRYAVGPDSETIRKLQDMVGKKEADSLLGWFNVEMAARAARLERAGITNADELKAALLEYLQFREGERAEDPIKKAERAIIGQKVGIDFFPTPAGESQRMVQMAGIKAGDRVLEPSAGNGNIADAAAAAGAKVDVLEISSQLREILKAKGYNIAGHDFMEFEPAEKYDAVLMNPPFSNRLDAAHIMRAYDMVKPGGKLVAIAGEGVFFGSDKKAVEFREWLEKHAAEVEQLPQGTFTDNKLLARTSANARVLVMEKR